MDIRACVRLRSAFAWPSVPVAYSGQHKCMRPIKSQEEVAPRIEEGYSEATEAGIHAAPVGTERQTVDWTWLMTPTHLREAIRSDQGWPCSMPIGYLALQYRRPRHPADPER